jgi:ElaB/YqjD/DUF883 family membrane-anchored ribosome-binding protein
MDYEPKVIHQQMDETRVSLTEKLETLEDQVTRTVQKATDLVSNTVDTVKHAVHESVDSVRESVHETVATVKETFDLHRQVDRHPWLMFSGSVAAGYLAGCLLGNERGRYSSGSAVRGSLYSARGNGESEEAPAPPSRTTTPMERPAHRPRWLGQLADRFAPEIAQLKGLAIGTTLGVVRDMIADAVPQHLEPRIREVMDSITQKLDGETIPSPVLSR